MSVLTLDEGVSKGAVRTQVHFSPDTIVVQKTFDAEPHLEYAKQAREATEGKRWGEGKLIGHIPPAFYAEILTIRDPQERQIAVERFFKENPAFVMFDRYGK